MNWVGVLAMLVCQEDEIAKQLVESGKTAAAWSSYAFQAESEVDSAFLGGSVRPKGAFQKDAAFTMKIDDTEVVRAKGKTVVKNPGEQWGKPPDQRGGDFNFKQLSTKHFPPPHELIGRMETKHFKSVKVDGATEFVSALECVVFEATLSEEGARAMSGLPPDIAGRAKNFEGTLKVWVDDTYTIRRYKLDAKASVGLGPMGDMVVSLKGKVDFDEIGAAKVEVPEAAKKALE